MKARLNLTIDDHLLTIMKTYAQRQSMSVSELVEDYFKQITKQSPRKNIIQLVEKLEKPAIPSQEDLKEQFYKDQAAKHGF